MDLKFRSVRENLVFYGIAKGNADENCEALVKELIKTHLEISTDKMKFDRARRLGTKKGKKPRPLVVKFHDFKDKEAVRTKSLEEEVKNSLKGKELGVGVQSPQEYREARNALYPLSKQERENGKETRIIGTHIIGNKLYVNNVIKNKYVNGKVYNFLHE